MEDSLKVDQNPDGTLVVEWDPKDPKYQFLNGLTEDQVQLIIKQAILEAIEDS